MCTHMYYLYMSVIQRLRTRSVCGHCISYRTSGDELAAAHPSVQHDEAGINLCANLADYSELKIAKALARHSVEIGLPKHYAPNHLVLEGKMHVVGVKAKKI